MHTKQEIEKGLISLETMITTMEITLKTIGNLTSFERGMKSQRTIGYLKPLVEFIEEKKEELI